MSGSFIRLTWWFLVLESPSHPKVIPKHVLNDCLLRLALLTCVTMLHSPVRLNTAVLLVQLLGPFGRGKNTWKNDGIFLESHLEVVHRAVTL